MNRRPTRAKAIHTSTRSPLLSRRDVIVPTGPDVAPPEPTPESRKKAAEDYRRVLEDVARSQSKDNARMPNATKGREH
jgi:hypothetical protein